MKNPKKKYLNRKETLYEGQKFGQWKVIDHGGSIITKACNQISLYRCVNKEGIFEQFSETQLKKMRRKLRQKKQRKVHVRRYRSKQHKFVLWVDGLNYYVTKRSGPKRDIKINEQFVQFFGNEEDAWRAAEERTKQLIQTLNGYIKFYRSERNRK